MKKIYIIGIGLGEKTITPEAQKAIDSAEVLIGAKRMLDIFKDKRKLSYPFYEPDKVADLISRSDSQSFAVLVSGDVGFYSAAAGISKALADHEVEFIPGISVVNAFFAKLKLPWQNTAFISLHGRDMNLIDTIRRNHMTFCLTGNNTKKVAADLSNAGFGNIKIYIGENLGTEQDRIYDAVAGELPDCQALTVLLFINNHFDDRTLTGLPDTSFARLEKIPMTKSEIRSVIMSKLKLKPRDICWDIGAGTGSVSVEMALSAYRGHVFAIERKPEAIDIVKQNIADFHIGNISAICGEAPAALISLPKPDAVFIGGSGGKLKNIIAIILDKNPKARIVLTAITLETISIALDAYKLLGIDPEITQISVSRGKNIIGLHMLEAQNPITVISAGGEST